MKGLGIRDLLVRFDIAEDGSSRCGRVSRGGCHEARVTKRVSESVALPRASPRAVTVLLCAKA